MLTLSGGWRITLHLLCALIVYLSQGEVLGYESFYPAAVGVGKTYF
jgi:hypothetical protein